MSESKLQSRSAAATGIRAQVFVNPGFGPRRSSFLFWANLPGMLMAIFSIMSVHPHVDAATRLRLEHLLLTNLVRRRLVTPTPTLPAMIRLHIGYAPTPRWSNHQSGHEEEASTHLLLSSSSCR